MLMRRTVLALCACAAMASSGVARVAAADWDPKPTRNVDDGDKTKTPIVFVHGASGAGDQFERQAAHYIANGYPPSWINTYDYSTAGGGGGGGARGRGARGRGAAAGAAAEGAAPASTTPAPPAAATPAPAAQAGDQPRYVQQSLDDFIDQVRKRTGHEKVNLLGHSAGTAQSARYLSDPAHAAKVNKYAAISGSNSEAVPHINITGRGDTGRPAAAGIGRNMPDYQDHVMVATSDESFEATYEFFNGEKPKNMSLISDKEVLVGGFCKSLYVNRPLPGNTIEVWEVAAETGKRIKDKPLASFTADERGKWGPFRADPKQHYEFVITDKNNPRPWSVFREPFTTTDLLVYFRVASTAEGYSRSFWNNNPQLLNDKSGAYVVMHENGSMVPAMMKLKVNGEDVLVQGVVNNPPIGQRQPTTVAIYMTDGNNNGKSDLARLQGSGGGFTGSCDVFVDASKEGSVQFKLNDRVLNVPIRKGSEGAVSVTFNDWNPLK